jgi:hypothetical protein
MRQPVRPDASPVVFFDIVNRVYDARFDAQWIHQSAVHTWSQTLSDYTARVFPHRGCHC